MTRFQSTLAAGAAFIFAGFAASAVLADTTLLNVSYDPTRELYKAVQRGLRRALEGRRPARPSPSSNRMAARASRPAR